MLEYLKEEVCEANITLPIYDLVKLTWGNVSGIDREKGLFVIKPSGIGYERLKPEIMVVVDLDGKKVEGEYKPSTDMEAHRALYKMFPQLGGITHTHSPYSTIFAQAGQSIPTFGTTHADYFYGEIPCARQMTDEEIANGYEYAMGLVIAEAFEGINPMYIPGVLLHGHGPFTWGKSAREAAHNAIVLEEVAKMAYMTKILNPATMPINQTLIDKHFLRKHGKNAYYGQ